MSRICRMDRRIEASLIWTDLDSSDNLGSTLICSGFAGIMTGVKWRCVSLAQAREFVQDVLGHILHFSKRQVVRGVPVAVTGCVV